MTTHPTPEAPSDGLIEECRDYADMLNAIPTRPMPGERLSAVDARHLDGAASTLTQAAARIQVLEAALKPFAEPHFMGDAYVKFAPRLILVARSALTGETGT